MTEDPGAQQRQPKSHKRSTLNRTVVRQPTPVSRFQDLPRDDGIIFRWMTPVTGIATDLVIYIDKIDGLEKDEKVELFIWIHEADGVIRKDVKVLPGLNELTLELTIPKSTRIVITCEQKEGQMLHGIWTSFLFGIKK